MQFERTFKSSTTERRGRQRKSGFTLIELSIALALLTLVILAAGTVLSNTSAAFATQVLSSRLVQTSRRVTERIAQDLRQADPTTLSPALLSNGTSISFNQVAGYWGGARQLGPLIALDYQPVAGETVNGVDDNGDGRVDEGILRYKSGTDPWIELARDILALRLSSTSSGVSFSVDVGVMDQDRGELVQITVTEEISFRN